MRAFRLSLVKRLAIDGSELIFGILVIGLIYLAYIWRLGSIVPGINTAESSNLAASSSLGSIKDSLLFAPYKLVELGFQKLPLSQIAAARLTSVSFVILFSICLYFGLSRWFGKPTAILACLFFLAAPYVLILGRTATPQVLFFAPMAFLAAYNWFIQANRHLWLAWLMLCITVGLCLYVPGLIWLLVVSLLFCPQQISKALKAISKYFLYGGILLLAATLTPLIIELVNRKVSVWDWFWLPANWPSVVQIFKNFAWSISALFFKTQSHTDFIVGRTPMLSILIIALSICGIYGLGLRLNRTLYWFGAFLGITLFLAAINQEITPLYFVLPVFTALAAIGVRFLYIEWRNVFPLNPLPRVLSLMLIAAVVVISVVYGLAYGLLAWPHNPEVKAAYMIKYH